MAAIQCVVWLVVAMDNGCLKDLFPGLRRAYKVSRAASLRLRAEEPSSINNSLGDITFNHVQRTTGKEAGYLRYFLAGF